ncbi:MAG: hypothetical protein OEY27_07760, partial [Gammaproteobacteria bacterium]|nr:hypothetical protein [Gammaproteobacteria bacterium]
RDADGLGAFSYQWLRGGVAIAGATASTYTLGDADVGAQISVQVSYTDAQGTAEGPLASAQTAPVANVNDTPTGAVVISGTLTEDQVLTASSNLADADGLGPISYQWQRNGLDITGATASTYTLGDADVGAAISVVASYTDGHGSAENVSSVAVGPIANVNDAPVGAPTITGAVTEDQVLTADTTGTRDADGLGAFSYQWLRGGVAIAGATASTYTLGDADVGAQISVRVAYTDGQGTLETVTSAQTAAVANVNDAPVGLPIIIGTVTEDQTLTADTSGISDADGLGAFSYRWLRNGEVISGANASTYTLGDADVGAQISVRVSYTDGQSGNETITSAQTAAVVNVNDAPVAADGTVTSAGNARYVFQQADFGYSDVDGDSLLKIRVTAIPSNGLLTLNGIDVTLNQEIPAADIAAGKFSFTPPTTNAGIVSETLQFQVHDGTVYSTSSYTLTLNILTIPIVLDADPAAPIDAPIVSEATPAPAAATQPATAAGDATVAADRTLPTSRDSETTDTLSTATTLLGADAFSPDAPLAIDGTATPLYRRVGSHGIAGVGPATMLPVAQINLVQLSLPQTGSLFSFSSSEIVVEATQSHAFTEGLDRLRDSMKTEAAEEQRVVASGIAVSAGLSVGYVVWLLRGGVLLTSLLTSLPVWRFIDPLPVLVRLREDKDENDDDESLESMVGTAPDRPQATVKKERHG